MLDGQRDAQFGDNRYQAQAVPRWPAVPPAAFRFDTIVRSELLSLVNGAIAAVLGTVHLPLPPEDDVV